VAIVVLTLMGFILSAGSFYILYWRSDFVEDIDPATAMGLVIIACVLALPTQLIYERLPLVPQPHFLRLRAAARRLAGRVRDARAFHLPSSSGEVSDVALIVRHDADVAKVRNEIPDLDAMFREELVRQGLAPSPSHRVPQVHVVSRDQIRRGGGPFHFWRDFGLF